MIAAPATCYELVRERGWPRPRTRVHPRRPKEGARACEPDELRHIDTTLIKLIDGTKVQLHAVIDNYYEEIPGIARCGTPRDGQHSAILTDAAPGATSEGTVGNQQPKADIGLTPEF